MMSVQITCPNCTSSIEVLPDHNARKVDCTVCQHTMDISFTAEDEKGILNRCPVCSRQDFYKQKDFNRKIGVALFVVAAILSLWTYGLSLVALYLVDLFLFKKLSLVAACYKCNTNFRNVTNMADIRNYDHEMNDRIIYNNEDFKGKPLSH